MATSRRRKSVRRNSRRRSLRRNGAYALVYHAIDSRFGGRTPEPFTAKNYRLVATVETPDLEEAFHLTNHIRRSWTENKGVTAHVPQPRSTSVGDVVALIDGNVANVFLCASAGWTDLGLRPVSKLPALP